MSSFICLKQSTSRRALIAQKIKAALYNIALALAVILLFVLIGVVLVLRATPMP